MKIIDNSFDGRWRRIWLLYGTLVALVVSNRIAPIVGEIIGSFRH